MKAPKLPVRGGSCRFAGMTGGNRASGMTLIELTVVVLVMLSLTVILFWGGQAWKNGSDRATCIINLEYVQKAVRSYANLNGYVPGMVVPGLEGYVIGPGRFVERQPACPGKGTYTTGGDQVPPLGVLYMSCSLAGTGHQPKDFTGW